MGESVKKEFRVSKIRFYQSEDGRKIEEYIYDFSIIEDQDEDGKVISSDLGDLLPEQVQVEYIGVAAAQTPIGMQEIKFPIKAETLEEAFAKWNSSIEGFLEEHESQIIQPGQGMGTSPSGLIV